MFCNRLAANFLEGSLVKWGRLQPVDFLSAGRNQNPQAEACATKALMNSSEVNGSYLADAG
jgi:hypothetical protein